MNIYVFICISIYIHIYTSIYIYIYIYIYMYTTSLERTWRHALEHFMAARFSEKYRSD